VLNLMIGLITPPVGIVIFVLSKISGLSFEKTLAAIVPWMIPLLATLLLITYIPELVMWLPNILYPE
jgi:TRAP-type C4-dicarboxylate transport system permease large subunit